MTQKQEENEIVIRPSLKWVRAGYTLVFAIVFVCVLLYANSSASERFPAWVAFLPVLLFLWPIRCHIQNHFTKMTLAGDKLRYETGVLGRSKRTIQLSKVQDVHVNQTLVQRLLRTGDLSLETAGETSLLTMHNVDEPDRVTEQILRAAHLDAGDHGKPQPKP